jgi:catechol 2,3-dioxygenase-like lactoylglutathione lyase family enzyme
MNIDHIGFAVSNFKKSKDFYTSTLSPLGLTIVGEGDTWAMMGKTKCDLWFGEIEGENPKPIHLAFVAENHEQVDVFYAKAMEAGATDNGKPGLTPEYGESYYAAFVIDINGHNLEAVCRT